AVTPRTISFICDLASAIFARTLAPPTAVSRNPARMAMMLMTTSSSMSVKARRRRDLGRMLDFMQPFFADAKDECMLTLPEGRQRLGPGAQVSNLLSRRFPIGGASPVPAPHRSRSACGLETRDTADWKSALRSLRTLLNTEEGRAAGAARLQIR